MSPGPDQHVRPAAADDAQIITALQVEAWRQTHTEMIGDEIIELLDLDQMTAQWRQAITSPPEPGCEVLVGVERADVVGFAAIGQGEILSLEVGPQWRRGGHGSRLLQACVDRLRAHGHEDVQTWVLASDEARQRFLSGAGFGPGGHKRELATGARDVTEHNWIASIG